MEERKEEICPLLFRGLRWRGHAAILAKPVLGHHELRKHKKGRLLCSRESGARSILCNAGPRGALPWNGIRLRTRRSLRLPAAEPLRHLQHASRASRIAEHSLVFSNL